MCQSVNSKDQILLVDDDRNITYMLSMLLETRGYHVVVAASGQEAFQKVNHHSDLIILDLCLPDADGFDVCRKLKANCETAHVPIIFLTARLLSQDIVEGLYLGADDYLTKPVDCEELVARMEAVMRRAARYKSGLEDNNGDDVVICELRNIIHEERIVPFFQPLYDLNTLKILGFEVLTRPKTDSLLANPEFLFKAALRYGCYEDLEILCWGKAAAYASQFLEDEKLFLNCNPYLVEGQKFKKVKSIFDMNHISPENVVLEITERSEVKNYQRFFGQLAFYRENGFKFAIDDVGGGYSSLESIVATKPEVVKIDQHIIAGIHKDNIKRSIVKFVTAFCKENGIICVAEGIETKEELDVVMDLGVDAGQGYYLCRPKAEIEVNIKFSIPS